MARVFSIVCALCLLLGAMDASAGRKRKKQRRASVPRAYQLLKAGHADAAESMFREILERAPEHRGALEGLTGPGRD